MDKVCTKIYCHFYFRGITLTVKDLSLSPGGRAIAVPGEVKGMHQASQRYGRLPWRELVEPAIRLARDGFEISAEVADALEDWPGEDVIREDPGLRFVIHAVVI